MHGEILWHVNKRCLGSHANPKWPAPSPNTFSQHLELARERSTAVHKGSHKSVALVGVLPCPFKLKGRLQLPALSFPAPRKPLDPVGFLDERFAIREWRPILWRVRLIVLTHTDLLSFFVQVLWSTFAVNWGLPSVTSFLRRSQPAVLIKEDDREVFSRGFPQGWHVQRELGQRFFGDTQGPWLSLGRCN